MSVCVLYVSVSLCPCVSLRSSLALRERVSVPILRVCWSLWRIRVGLRNSVCQCLRDV
eukprot:EC716540.1.p4 GENE.EC716540.1~~EC716540.1.p4  ORF type:complete len:58 (+),score=6.19 EC716540.1:490-663(+)